MIARIVTLSLFLLVLSGCIYDDEPLPQITGIYEPEIIVPAPSPPVKIDNHVDVPYGWIPSKHLEKRWTAIIIHHSDTENGNARIFDKYHRETKHWNGIGYDFVIGNGTNSGNGQVEVTDRWKYQKTGAHCGGTAGNWANKDGIGICLVGDFDRSYPNSRQMQSLSRLVRFLQKRYGIANDRVYGHNATPGARVTDCPGTKFSMSRFKSML